MIGLDRPPMTQAHAGVTWQMRQMGSADVVNGQNHAAVVHFGMGDATTALEVRVEWPSGLVTVQHGVPINQTLLLTEPDVVPEAGPGGILNPVNRFTADLALTKEVAVAGTASGLEATYTRRATGTRNSYFPLSGFLKRRKRNDGGLDLLEC